MHKVKPTLKARKYQEKICRASDAHSFSRGDFRRACHSQRPRSYDLLPRARLNSAAPQIDLLLSPTRLLYPFLFHAVARDFEKFTHRNRLLTLWYFFLFTDPWKIRLLSWAAWWKMMVFVKWQSIFIIWIFWREFFLKTWFYYLVYFLCGLWFLI